MESFFGIGIPELVVILIIAGIVMGPERIGVAARWLGRTTAQLQAISRGFMQQLNDEIDGLQDSTEIRGAVQDVQDLRSQIDQLKQELLSVANGAAREGRGALKQTEEELRRTIAPPRKDEALNAGETSDTAVNPASLPSRVNVPDDPEE